MQRSGTNIVMEKFAPMKSAWGFWAYLK